MAAGIMQREVHIQAPVTQRPRCGASHVTRLGGLLKFHHEVGDTQPRHPNAQEAPSSAIGVTIKPSAYVSCR